MNSFMDLTTWADFYSSGCHGVTPTSRQVPSASLDSRIKNRSRMFYTVAEMEAKLVDPDAQSIILDTNGFVTENKGGNVFCVRDGVIRTPTTVNALEGLSRQTVLELAESIGVPTVEEPLLPYDFATADEAFFTSTPYCIMPCTKFNGIGVGDGEVGPVVKALLEAWSERVGVDIVAQARAQMEQPIDAGGGR